MKNEHKEVLFPFPLLPGASPRAPASTACYEKGTRDGDSLFHWNLKEELSVTRDGDSLFHCNLKEELSVRDLNSSLSFLAVPPHTSY